eukprot:GHVP01025356.1.p1 GENE.GHVP01025356.1~~GHVP01025356.1.p1  ORF type:complete len:144 (-),score=8.85 GHVP01025356.1:755-1186(-)
MSKVLTLMSKILTLIVFFFHYFFMIHSSHSHITFFWIIFWKTSYFHSGFVPVVSIPDLTFSVSCICFVQQFEHKDIWEYFGLLGSVMIFIGVPENTALGSFLVAEASNFVCDAFEDDLWFRILAFKQDSVNSLHQLLQRSERF